MRRLFSRVVAVAIAALPVWAWAGDHAPPPIDLELILAVDASESIKIEEMLTQRAGYVAALRSTEVADAIAARGGIALSYVEWAGPDSQRVVVPWTHLRGGGEAADFAARLAAAPINPFGNRSHRERATCISGALLFAASMFSSTATSNVIDISGDGRQNVGPDLAMARNWVVAQGVVINGLPLLISPTGSSAQLELYYREFVIGGRGAFVVPVDSLARFEDAIRRKLVQEIAAVPVSGQDVADGAIAAGAAWLASLRPKGNERTLQDRDGAPYGNRTRLCNVKGCRPNR
jgi:hypothetical protein